MSSDNIEADNFSNGFCVDEGAPVEGTAEWNLETEIITEDMFDYLTETNETDQVRVINVMSVVLKILSTMSFKQLSTSEKIPVLPNKVTQPYVQSQSTSVYSYNLSIKNLSG